MDAHQAVRSTLTEQVAQTHPDLDVRDIWQVVSQNVGERTAWRERVQRQRMVARVHERIRWRRGDFAQESRRLVRLVLISCGRRLSVRQMMANHRLAKSTHDAAWTLFAALLACKAAWAGRQVVAVDLASRGTGRPGCGHRNTDLTLADRIYTCARCGLVLDRDRNAAWNILARGRQMIALG